MMRLLPGGLCFAHGPYDPPLMQCPKWPNCATDTQQQKWIDLAASRSRHDILLQAAALLEGFNMLPDTVVMLRKESEKYPWRP